MMYQELNVKMKQAQEGIARLHKIDSMLAALETEKETLVIKTGQLRSVMEKEKYDVEKLENTSIASVFYSILGSLDEHAEKERREFLAAKLKFDQAVRDGNDVKHQISKLNDERAGLVGCHAEYERLYAQKKKELIQAADGTAQKLSNLTDSLNQSEINHKEIKEAIAAGNRVLDSLNMALDHLDSAEGWGTFDLLGGGLISDLAKHSHIDNAKYEIETTQRLLRQFKTELTDISVSADICIDTEGFAKFADFFFDGLIADWFMQSKIHSSQDSVTNVKEQVLNILEGLRCMGEKENENLSKLDEEINMIIIKA